MRLYHLVPDIYRTLDARNGYTLLALCDTLQSTLDTIQQDLGQLYDNWFIETCEAWCLDYLAPLVGIKPLDRAVAIALDNALRVRIANACSVRAHAGTTGGMVAAAHGASGWPAQVQEASARLIATEPLGFADPHRTATAAIAVGETLPPAVGRLRGLARIGSLPPTGTPPGLAGLHPNGAAVMLYRLQSLARRQTPPGALPEAKHVQVFGFHPLGVRQQLFHLPTASMAPCTNPTLAALPHPISRAGLRADLAEAHRGGPNKSTYVRTDLPVLRIQRRQGDSWQDVAPSQMVVADLGDGGLDAIPAPRAGTVLVDPVWGRFAVPLTQKSDAFRADHGYGAPARLGGGAYPRPLPPPVANHWIGLVWDHDKAPDWAPDGTEAFLTLQAALDAWHSDDKGHDGMARDGILYIATNDRYAPDSTKKAWDIMLGRRRLTISATDQVQPIIEGAVTVTADDGRAALTIDGLMLAAPLSLSGPMAFSAHQATLSPPRAGVDAHPAITVQSDIGAAVVSMRHCISGAITAGPFAGPIEIQDSIVDAGGGTWAVSAPNGTNGAPLSLAGATLLGGAATAWLRHATDCIVDGPLQAVGLDAGAVSDTVAESGPPPVRPSDTDDTRVAFDSRRYGAAAYARLAEAAGEFVRGGPTSRGTQIGAYRNGYEALRLRELERSVQEVVPIGMQLDLVLRT